MAYQAIFKRYELKYLLDLQQKQRLLEAMEPYMALDKYGRTIIRNVYFDTENYRLIRRSMEKPVYKEKLRLRSYRQAEADSSVFVELKKKYKGVVYKRRVAMPEKQAMDWLSGEGDPGQEGQIIREIDYFRNFYGSLRPMVFLSYEREAFFCRQGGGFRVTLDENILCRRDRLSLEQPPGGTAILPPDKVLLEVKTAGGLPGWMTEFLSRERLYKTSFSKYGTAYTGLILPNFKGECIYAGNLVSGDL